jgi:indoleamine 2,3-dioxygenase
MRKKSYTDGFFSVDSINGFLPIEQPLITLPKVYSPLQELLTQMPILTDQGQEGLLAREGLIEDYVHKLPNFINQVDQETNRFVQQALFRAYAFVASAYTLAPAYHYYLKHGTYGKAHGKLPKNISQPFVSVASQLDVYPWLDYHYAYSLGNYKKLDPNRGMNWENLGMCVKFSGLPDECGFIMLHVDINQYSPALIGGVFEALDSNNSESLNHALEGLVATMKNINSRRKLMWEASRWKHYNDFRAFIMGIKGNDDIFENGLVYQGVWDEPKAFRGQTGAQDNIIPTMDIFSGVIAHYPENDLTRYLIDLRSYRPKCIQQFLEDLRKIMFQKPLVGTLKNQNNQKGAIYLLELLEEIYLFRNGHWQFVQKYIMQNTAYPKATGGTPITSWIPNQIKAVLLAMIQTHDIIDPNYKPKDREDWVISYRRKVSLLNKQLDMLKVDQFDPKKLFDLNQKMRLRDF